MSFIKSLQHSLICIKLLTFIVTFLSDPRIIDLLNAQGGNCGDVYSS